LAYVTAINFIRSLFDTHSTRVIYVGYIKRFLAMRFRVGRKYKGGKLAASKRWSANNPTYQAEWRRRRREAAGTTPQRVGRPRKRRPNFLANMFGQNTKKVQSLEGFTLLEATGSEYEFKLRSSTIHGLGVFTTCAVPAETFLMEYHGDIVPMAEADAREERYRQAGTAIYLFGLSDDFVIDATMTGNVARFVNHSCSPNSITELGDDGNSIRLVALRNLTNGEEITIDYNLQEGTRIECLCKSAACRSQL
jgi:hypothetical protein